MLVVCGSMSGSPVMAGADAVSHPHEGLGDRQHGGALLRVADVLRGGNAIIRFTSVLLSIRHGLTGSAAPSMLDQTPAFLELRNFCMGPYRSGNLNWPAYLGRLGWNRPMRSLSS